MNIPASNICMNITASEIFVIITAICIHIYTYNRQLTTPSKAHVNGPRWSHALRCKNEENVAAKLLSPALWAQIGLGCLLD